MNIQSTLYGVVPHSGVFYCAVLGVILAVLAGCGIVADKDRVVIATLDGKNITRGDLFAIIRGMEDAKRPHIRNKSDLLRVLNQHIDEQIKIPLGRRLEQEGLINMPWELGLEQFFQNSGDQQDYYRMIWNMEAPAGGQTTPLMDVYNLTAVQIESTKAIIAQEVDFLLERMLGEAAILRLVADDIKQGDIIYDEQALEREYRLRRGQFKSLEWMRFRGIRFPASLPNAEQRAAEISNRLKAGERFEEIFEEFRSLDPGKVIESEIVNNPALSKFRGFWLAASGEEPGAVVGPVYLPEYTMQMEDNRGQITAETMPDAYMIFEVLEREDGREQTLEEVRGQLLPELILAEKMKELCAQHGVQIFEDKLPDPAQFAKDDPYAALDQLNVQ